MKGVTLNIGKNGTSISYGVRGACVTQGKGRKTVSVGVPGTGVSYRKTVNTNNKQKINTVYNAQKQPPQRTKAQNKTWGTVFLVLGIIILLLAFTASLVTFGRFVIGAIGAFCLIASFAYFNAESIDDVKEVSSEDASAVKKNSKLNLATLIGLFLLILFSYLFYASFGWSWQDHSKYNIYITYDLSWLKWIFYPIVLIGLALGAISTYIGLSNNNKN